MAAPIEIKISKRQAQGLSILNSLQKRIVLFFGGSRSGKTFIICLWIFLRAIKYPGSAHLVARYARAKAKQSIWTQTILPLARFFSQRGIGLRIFRSSDNLSIQFGNGSYILIEGLEPSRINGVLGAEYATIYINECNENKWTEVELLQSRLNAMQKDSEGNVIQTKFICDLNPTTKNSWHYRLFIRKIDPITQKVRKDAKEIFSLWFHPAHNQKNLAASYISQLESGSPEYRRRFLEGRYGSFEGLVYKLTEHNIIDDFVLPGPKARTLGRWRLFRAVDFGFWPDPFCFLWGAHDVVNNRIIIYRELYVHKVIVRNNAHMIARMSEQDGWEPEKRGKQALTVPNDCDEYYSLLKRRKFGWIDQMYEPAEADHDAEDRVTLSDGGITTAAADKRRQIGIDHVSFLLDGDPKRGKRPILYVARECTNLLTEFESYRWVDAKEDRKNKERETVPGSDHALDALRYMCMRIANPISDDDFDPFDS